MKTLVASILAAMILLPAAAFAQTRGGNKPAAPVKTKQYDFSGDTIDGELVKPEGEFVNTRKFATHTSLIRVRADFIKEITKSAEDR